MFLRKALATVSAVAFMSASPAFSEETSPSVLEALKALGMDYSEISERSPGTAVIGASLTRWGVTISAPIVTIENLPEGALIMAPDGATISRKGKPVLSVSPGDVSVLTTGLDAAGNGRHELRATSLEVSGDGFGAATFRNLAAVVDGSVGIEGDVSLEGTYEASEVSAKSAFGASGQAVSVSGSASLKIPESVLIARADPASEADLSAVGASFSAVFGESVARAESGDGGKAEMSVSGGSVEAGVQAGRSSVSASLSDFFASASQVGDAPPMGVSAEIASLSFGSPSYASSEEPFTATYEMSGISFSDDFWMRADPKGEIDRSPGRVKLAFSGRLLPGGERSVRADDVSVNIAGVSLNATTSLTLDGAGIDGVSGTARVMLSGAERLIGVGQGSGFFPPQIAAGARMGLAMFFRKDGEDRLLSDVTAERGSITVNGIRIR